MNESLKIAIGSDHAGLEMKDVVVQQLKKLGHTLKDFGTNSDESVDYPDFAHPISTAVKNGEYDFGILVCGSGNGMCITANKHEGIRAGLAWNKEVAALVKQHNNANVLCIPGRFVDPKTVREIVKSYLNADFEGDRHQRRINKISC